MIEIRAATAAEMGAIGTLGGYVYGGTFGDGPESMTATANRPEWTLCAFDGPVLAASFATIPFTMRIDGAAMALGGVSAVATRPDYRRRGLMRRLMTQATADMADRGQAIAALWASQAAIYRRFGYAVGSYLRRYEVDTADIVFHDGDDGSSAVTWEPVAESLDTIRAIYRDFVAERTGYLHRSRPLWENGPLAAPDEDGPVNVAVARDENGSVDGYLVYTLRGRRVPNVARSQELVIRDLAWLSLDAYRSLWRYVAGHDLVGRVVWTGAPADDPAEDLLAEPRLLHRRDDEGIWFRVIDVEPALTERCFGTPGHATIEVVGDELTPWNAGRYAIESDGSTASVERLTGPAASRGRPSATVSIAGLSALFIGSRPARQVRATGGLDADDHGCAQLDALFATRHFPHCPDHF